MNLVVGEAGVATLRRHRAALPLVAVDRMLDERALALGDARRPERLVADLRRAGDAGFVARLADLREHLLAAHVPARGRRLGDHDSAERLDALEHLRLVFAHVARAAGEELRQ